MKIRRFFAPDMKTALRQVSEELGPDAAIMSSRKADGGVEVVAALDYNPDTVATVKRDNNPQQSTQHKKVEWSQEPNLVAIRQEVSMLKELLQEQLGELTLSPNPSVATYAEVETGIFRSGEPAPQINIVATPSYDSFFNGLGVITDNFTLRGEQQAVVMGI